MHVFVIALLQVNTVRKFNLGIVMVIRLACWGKA